ncbi:hypothetical protein GWK47_048650 [Chionoecetes opilio]|uniref:Uncharacterized protein n=1 Tax=Chionoecetes opilio TaxID=41210 RepID=A0A8J4Y4G4_CHIOP|nr:hypothetical protein GWK47_048650 [Chionoecetes opilio]
MSNYSNHGKCLEQGPVKRNDKALATSRAQQPIGQAAYSTFMPGSRDKKDVELLKQASAQQPAQQQLQGQQQTQQAQQQQQPQQSQQQQQTQQTVQQAVAMATAAGGALGVSSTISTTGVTQHAPQNVIIVSNWLACLATNLRALVRIRARASR